MFENDADVDQEYQETVGLTEDDLRIHYRAAFMTLIPAWDRRHMDESNGRPVDLQQFQGQMELAYRQMVEARQVMEMLYLS